MKKLWSLGLVLILAGCASSSPDVIQRGDTQRLSIVEDAVVLSVRNVVVEGSQSGAGAATGGVLGGLAGYGAGSGQREGQIIGILGAVAGAVAGNVIERAGTREDSFEILIQLKKSGERRAIVQGKGEETFVSGDPVILVTTGGKVRLAKAPK